MYLSDFFTPDLGFLGAFTYVEHNTPEHIGT